MTAVDHLSELRRRIIYVLVVFVVLLFACLGFVSHIYSYLVSPLQQDGFKLMVIGPGEVITVYFTIAGIVATGLSVPFALYQTWLFVRPGLRPIERRYTVQLLPFTLALFVCGVLFAWFVIFPTILHFLLRIASAQFVVNIRAELYFSFLSMICVPFGFIFELPLVVVFLTRIGVISARFLQRIRRYAYLVIVLIGVLISPPELISHLSVTIPMAVLYEISIVLSRLVERRKLAAERRKAAAEAQSEQHRANGDASGPQN